MGRASGPVRTCLSRPRANRTSARWPRIIWRQDHHVHDFSRSFCRGMPLGVKALDCFSDMFRPGITEGFSVDLVNLLDQLYLSASIEACPDIGLDDGNPIIFRIEHL